MPVMVQTPLPIDAHIEQIIAHVRAKRSAVIVAPPGSGKTTRLPPALTARLQGDPLLSEFRVVVLDEFHERSVHADLALALVKQAAIARDDLAIVVMSATLDAGEVSRFLDGARVFEIHARAHPITIEY